jgi:xanthine dehydrogenase YagT iron-sulfur-binding subunit
MSINSDKPLPRGDDPGSEGAAHPEAVEDGLSRRAFLHQATAGGLAVAAGASGSAASWGAEGKPARPEQPNAMPVSLHINGRKHELRLEPRVTLLDALRENLGLTGSTRAGITASAAPAPSWSRAAASTRA